MSVSNDTDQLFMAQILSCTLILTITFILMLSRIEIRRSYFDKKEHETQVKCTLDYVWNEKNNSNSPIHKYI